MGLTSQIAGACFIFTRNDNLFLFASPLGERMQGEGVIYVFIIAFVFSSSKKVCVYEQITRCNYNSSKNRAVNKRFKPFVLLL